MAFQGRTSKNVLFYLYVSFRKLLETGHKDPGFQVLCILTSKRVLRMPSNVKNHFFTLKQIFGTLRFK